MLRASLDAGDGESVELWSLVSGSREFLDIASLVQHGERTADRDSELWVLALEVCIECFTRVRHCSRGLEPDGPSGEWPLLVHEVLSHRQARPTACEGQELLVRHRAR